MTTIEERDAKGHIVKSGLTSERAKELARLSLERRAERKRQEADVLADAILGALPDVPEEQLEARRAIVCKLAGMANHKSRVGLRALMRLEAMLPEIEPPKPTYSFVIAPSEPKPQAAPPAAAPPAAPSSAAARMTPRPNPMAEFIVGGTGGPRWNGMKLARQLPGGLR